MTEPSKKKTLIIKVLDSRRFCPNIRREEICQIQTAHMQALDSSESGLNESSSVVMSLSLGQIFRFHCTPTKQNLLNTWLNYFLPVFELVLPSLSYCVIEPDRLIDELTVNFRLQFINSLPLQSVRVIAQYPSVKIYLIKSPK